MKWIVYGCGGLLLGVVALLSGDIRKTFFTAMVLALQADVNLSLGEVERSSYLGNSGPGSFFIPLTVLLAGVFLTVHWLAETLGKRRFRWSCGPLTFPWVLFLLTAGVTIAYAPELRPVAYYLQLPIFGYVICLVCANSVQHQRDVTRVLKLLLVVLATQSLIYYVENITGVTVTLTGDVLQGVSGSGLHRHGGTVSSNPNAFAMFITPLTLLALATFLTAANRRLKRWSGLLVVMGVASILLTFSRGAWSGFAMSSLVIFWIGLRRKRIAGARLIFVCAMAAIPLLALLPMVLVRLSADHVADYEERAMLARIAWRIIENNMFSGVGAGQYAIAMKHYILPAERARWLFVVHNYFLLLWAETGLLGLLSFLLLVATGFRSALHCTRSRDEATFAIGLAWCGGLVHLCWSLWWETGLGGAFALFWFMTGAVQAAAMIEKRARATETVSVRPTQRRRHAAVAYGAAR